MRFCGRKRGESRRAWRAYLIYQGTPPEERTQRGVLDRMGPLGRQPAQVTRWAERFNWEARALANARLVEERERLERIRTLELKADDLRVKMVAPLLDAMKRYNALIAQGEGHGSQELLDVQFVIATAIPLAEEAMLLTGRPEHAESVFKARQSRATADRAELIAAVAGSGPNALGLN